MNSPFFAVAAIPTTVLIAFNLYRQYKACQWGRCISNTCLRGKTFLITGANSGLGFETARALIMRKARVIFACRDIEKAREAVKSLRKEFPTLGELIPMQLDLASFESIEKFVEIVKAGFHKIDVLINNAGVYMPLKEDMKTKEGFELHFGVNYLGHYYLTTLLLDLLKRGSPSRIVVVSSRLHEHAKIDFNDINLRAEIERAKAGGKVHRHNLGYCNSKLMNVYFARTLAEQLRSFGVDVHACCPGFCYTSLFRYAAKWYHYILMTPIALLFMKTADQGAETILHCATDYNIEGQTGKFYRDCKEYIPNYKYSKDEQNKLWALSEKLVKARKPLEAHSI